MKAYSIYHGMDDEAKTPLGVAIFNDDGTLERVDLPVDQSLFTDVLRDHDTVTEMSQRFKSWAFVPEGGTP